MDSVDFVDFDFFVGAMATYGVVEDEDEGRKEEGSVDAPRLRFWWCGLILSSSAT